jgi:hypothetical protein
MTDLRRIYLELAKLYEILYITPVLDHTLTKQTQNTQKTATYELAYICTCISYAKNIADKILNAKCTIGNYKFILIIYSNI